MVDAMDTMLVMGEPMKADYEEIKVWMTANFAQVRVAHSWPTNVYHTNIDRYMMNLLMASSAILTVQSEQYDWPSSHLS